jgi:hypothetical protein
MGMIEVFRDDFTSGTLLQQFIGNGSIVLPGDVAQLTCPNSAYCEWVHNVGPTTPILWDDFSAFMALSTPVMPVRLQTKLNSFVRTHNYSLTGLCVFEDFVTPNWFYYISYYPNEGRIIVDYYYGTGGSRLANTGAIVDPNTTPHHYRFYWNPNAVYSVYIPETGTLLAPDYIGFAYSIDDGATWTMLHTRARDFDFTKAGVFARKWATGAGDNCTAEYEFFLAEQYDTDCLVLVSDAPGSKRDQVGLEDSTSIFTLSGKPRFDLPEYGDAFEFGEPAIGLEDAGGPVGQQGGKPRFDLPELDHDLLLPQEKCGFEDGFAPVFADEAADFYVKQVDGDGKIALYDGGILNVLHIDTTVGGFGDPTSNNHWGAAADGKFYADGAECGPGDFGTLAGGLRRTAWRGSGVEPLARRMSSGLAPAMQADDVVRLSTGGSQSGTPDSTSAVTSRLCWQLQGDFDIQISFANFTPSGTVQWGFEVRSTGLDAPEGRNTVSIYGYNGGVIAGRYNNSAWGQKGSVGGTQTSGMFRITRVGSTFSCYYWTGSWTIIGSSFSDANVGTGDCFVVCLIQGGTGDGYVDLSAFTINSGTTSNRAGWYLEAAGDHRGALQAAPADMLATVSKTAVDLVDETTGKLWMRFLLATSNVLSGDGAQRERPRCLIWQDGCLLVAFGNGPDDTERGAGILIDFTLDSVRWHREAAAGETGGTYWGTIERANGGIQHRNAAKNYAGDDDNWRIPDYRVWTVDMWQSAGYQHRAFATLAGVGIARWQRWYLQPTPTIAYGFSNETDRTIWCKFRESNGQLFYIDWPTNVGAGLTRPPSKLYSAVRTTWEAALPTGSFSANTSKNLPGSRSGMYQYMVELDPSSTTVWAPSNEGIYVVDWPTGSWSLLYGPPGSGATHEILPRGTVGTIRYFLDGAAPLLLVGLEDPYQILVINLTTNVVYCKGKIWRGLTPLALAAKA